MNSTIDRDTIKDSLKLSDGVMFPFMYRISQNWTAFKPESTDTTPGGRDLLHFINDINYRAYLRDSKKLDEEYSGSYVMYCKGEFITSGPDDETVYKKGIKIVRDRKLDGSLFIKQVD